MVKRGWGLFGLSLRKIEARRIGELCPPTTKPIFTIKKSWTMSERRNNSMNETETAFSYPFLQSSSGSEWKCVSKRFFWSSVQLFGRLQFTSWLGIWELIIGFTVMLAREFFLCHCSSGLFDDFIVTAPPSDQWMPSTCQVLGAPAQSCQSASESGCETCGAVKSEI